MIVTAGWKNVTALYRCSHLSVFLAFTLCSPGLVPVVSAGTPQLSIPVVTVAPQIDGHLTDEVWREAVTVDSFYQRLPTQGAVVSEKTVVALARDTHMLYVGAHMYDSNPHLIKARELREDVGELIDDTFTIALDSLLDRRNAYVFWVNPLGTKAEGRIEENSILRVEWDGIWYAAVSRNTDGWTAELAIPFKTLSVTPAGDTWGLELERYLPRNNEFALWANHDQDLDLSYVAAFGDMHGMTGVDQGRGLDIRPQLALRHRHRHDSGDKDGEIKPGLEVIYKLRPSLNASLVVNPDFSNTVVDDIKTNLTRFDLFFPEQRDFFVRDADIFQFGGLAETNGIPFFSRRVGLPFDIENPEPLDIDAGAKLSGRVGRYTVGMMNTQMGSGQGFSSKNLSVTRVAADVHRESRAGAIFTWGNPLGPADNGVAGVDYHYRNSELFGSRVFLADAFLMRSFTAGIDSDELAYGVTLDYPNDRWNGKLGYREIQRNFNPALGFVNRSGIRQYDHQLRYRIRPGNNRFFRSMNWGYETSWTTGTGNELESAYTWLRVFDLESHSGDIYALWFNWEHETLAAPFAIQPGVVIPAGEYNFYNVWGQVATAKHRPVSVLVEYKLGEFYDGDQVEVLSRIEWRPWRHFYLSYERHVFDINLPHGNFDIEINRARFNINFTPTLSWTNYVQQESESHIMTLQSQLRWIINPGNEFTLTLNHDWARQAASYKSREADLFARLVWTTRY